jgi:cardiolipin synthase
VGRIIHLNNRNHRKIFTIDHETSWVGGMNIVEKHCREFSADETWRDFSARISGPSLKSFFSSFENSWASSWGLENPNFFKFRRTRISRSPLVRLNNSFFVRRKNYRSLLKRIRTCKNRVWIMNSYFVPHRSLIRSLIKAASSNKDVRIIVPWTSDVFFMRWVFLSYLRGLLQAGIRVYLYKPSILHAKTILIDDWALVGSSNLNYRSLIHDLEVDVVLTSDESKLKLQNLFEVDFSVSEEWTFEHWRRVPRWERALGRLFLLIRYWT